MDDNRDLHPDPDPDPDPDLNPPPEPSPVDLEFQRFQNLSPTIDHAIKLAFGPTGYVRVRHLPNKNVFIGGFHGLDQFEHPRIITTSLSQFLKEIQEQYSRSISGNDFIEPKDYL